MLKPGNVKLLFILCLFLGTGAFFPCSKDVDDVQNYNNDPAQGTITFTSRGDKVHCTPDYNYAEFYAPPLQTMKEKTLEYLISRDKRNTTTGIMVLLSK